MLSSLLQMNLVAGCFYDGVLLYAMVLNETLREGGSKKNATQLIEKMRDRKFQGSSRERGLFGGRWAAGIGPVLHIPPGPRLSHRGDGTGEHGQQQRP